MDWDDLRVFLAAVRAGDFTTASRSLELNRTTIGRRLQRLEKAIGRDIWERDREQPRPTEAGHAILAAAEAMERAIDRLDAELKGDPPLRPVRLASALGLAQLFMGEIAAAREGLDLVLEMPRLPDPVAALQNRHADLGLALIASPPADLAGIRVAALELGLFAAGEDVQGRIGWTRGALSAQPQAWARANDPSDSQATAEVEDHAALRDGIAAGLGAAWFWRGEAQTEWVERAPGDGERVPAPINLWLLHRPVAGIDPVAHRFAERFAENLSRRLSY